MRFRQKDRWMWLASRKLKWRRRVPWYYLNRQIYLFDYRKNAWSPVPFYLWVHTMQFELYYFIRIRATRLEFFAKHDLLSVSYTPPLKFAKHGFKRDLIKHVGAHMQTRSWHHTKPHPPARADYALLNEFEVYYFL